MELDVILLNRKRWWNSVDSGVQYDFENAIVLNLYRMLKDGKISSYAGFFAEIIDFAVQYGGGSNPAWALSDTKLVSGVKDSLFSALKKYFGIKNALATFEDYAIRDLTKA